ncbi:MAG: SMP-30/gluconolactonase/LRE family protein [Terracidiphilus sp.]
MKTFERATSVDSLLNLNEPLLPKEAFTTFCDGLDHPEGLAFDCEHHLWAGGELGQIYRIDPEGHASEIARLGGFCLGLTFSASQDLWVCNSGLHSMMQLDRNGRVLATINDVNGTELMTPNFAVFDHKGNLYFSDSGHWDRANGYVYRVSSSGKAGYFAGPFAFANGLAMSADDQYLFVVESQRDRVIRIPIREDFDAGDAEIYAEKLARVPDGIALDAGGNLYVTCYASDCIYCVAPDRSVHLLAFDPEGTRIARPTNVAFGGPNFDDLYVANLGRWHIGKVHLGSVGQRLVNLECP